LSIEGDGARTNGAQVRHHTLQAVVQRHAHNVALADTSLCTTTAHYK
jgi:hypothetical protein